MFLLEIVVSLPSKVDGTGLLHRTGDFLLELLLFKKTVRFGGERRRGDSTVGPEAAITTEIREI